MKDTVANYWTTANQFIILGDFLDKRSLNIKLLLYELLFNLIDKEAKILQDNINGLWLHIEY